MNKSNRHNKGQSLVEVALFLPILLIILAGIIEVSQLVITKNRVVEASRSAARFGSNGGENSALATVALTTITQTLVTNEEQWDIWAVRGTVNRDGTGFVPNTWEFEHEYGLGSTQVFSDVVEADIQAKVLEQLQTNVDGNTNRTAAGDLRFVGAYVVHDVDSILGLDAMPGLTGLHSIEELSVMRVVGVSRVVTNGCDAFPIAVYEGTRSVTPVGVAPEPYPESFFNGSASPEYNQFVYHRPNVALADAQEGYIYKIYDGGGAGNMGWLRWNEGLNTSNNNLAASMTWPGNSTDYTNCSSDGCTGSGIAGEKFWGYAEPTDSTDRAMHIGDKVWGLTGVVNSNAVRNIVNEHVALGRTLRLPIWSSFEGSGANATYTIAGFAIFRLHGHNITGNDGFILAEFIRSDNSCGQAE